MCGTHPWSEGMRLESDSRLPDTVKSKNHSRKSESGGGAWALNPALIVAQIAFFLRCDTKREV